LAIIKEDNMKDTNRRQFLKHTAAAAATVPFAVHASNSDVIKIGLIGCGGRGTGAASQALQADKHIKLITMGDMFEDRLEKSLNTLRKVPEVKGKVDVPRERQFVGWDAYKKVLASGVDCVLLTTPPHFRPAHLKAAIAAGKHVFAEKPVAVDAPGVRSVLETCKLARKKGLSVVSGLCLRYGNGFRAMMKRIHGGDIGEVHTLYANDYRGTIWYKERQPDWTDMHYQMRNWYYYTWLSGDFNVEQHVHYLDICAWAKGEYPVKAIGMGGREVRHEAKYGNIFDHHSVVYEFADGARLVSNTRQIKGCKSDMSAQVIGSKGRANINESARGIHLEQPGRDRWTFEGEKNNFYQTEHDEMYAGIRAGKPLNNGEYMAHSTLLAIMGRMATYTGQQVTWSQALNSKEDLIPLKYAWGDAPEAPLAVPGMTKLI
jgi:predicted dehydrogenase